MRRLSSSQLLLLLALAGGTVLVLSLVVVGLVHALPNPVADIIIHSH